jgi:HD-like signal output (HDOD) protein/ActR/RegA family two-component response regulator
VTETSGAAPRPRVLFVDDEPAILSGLRNVLHPHHRRWEMRFACGGAQALELLEAAPAEVVITDMRMPEMDGLELLRKVQQRWPLATRIVLSGYAHLATVAQASAVAHQYLLKPCDPEVLALTIGRAIELQGLLASAKLREAVGSLGSLPTGPRMYQQLTAALANPDVEVRVLARIVEGDLAMSSRILHFVNSAYYGLVRKVSSIEEGIVLLGFATLRSLSLTLEVFAAFPGGRAPGAFEAEANHALLTAHIARHIVAEPARAEAVFAAGLLHDCGRLIFLDRLPAQLTEVEETAAREGQPLHVAERAVLGADHAEVGAYVLGLWGLPRPVVEAVAFHHAVLESTRTLDAVSAVAVGNRLARAVAPGASRSDRPDDAWLHELAAGPGSAWLEYARREAERLGERGGGP